jgi:hypothetical protein
MMIRELKFEYQILTWYAGNKDAINGSYAAAPEGICKQKPTGPDNVTG